MPVSFNQIPQGWKLPLVYIEVDPSQAGTATSTKYALLSDYKIAAGTAVADQVIACGTVAEARDLAGRGSPLARMYEKFFTLNKSTPVFLLPITEPGGGTAANGDITVTGAPTASGIYNLYIAGQKVPVTIVASETTAQTVARFKTAIDAALDLPVTCAAPVGSAVKITAKWKGVTGNEIRCDANVLGANGGEVTPAGLTVTFPTNNVLAAGDGVPTWTNAIAALGDDDYEFVGIGPTDTGTISAWNLEYGFTDSGRWGWLREDYGHVFGAYRGTGTGTGYSGLMSYGVDNNSGVISLMGFELQSPSPAWEWAGAYCARAAGALSIDPARPLHTLSFEGIVPAPKGLRFNKTELNAIAGVGLAIQSVNADGVPAILREQTTYQKNTHSQADNAYELVTTLATLAELFRRLRQSITNKYPRHKLANDGTRFGPGQAIVTPNVIRAELVAEYRSCEYDGLVENTDAFKKHLIVERDNTDPNRVNVLFPPDIINQLRLFAVLGQFRLQYPSEQFAV